MKLNGGDEFGRGVGGLGTILFSHSLHEQFLPLYCVQSVREITVNKSRPCPYGGYVLLRERDNNTVNKASNETVLIVALFEGYDGGNSIGQGASSDGLANKEFSGELTFEKEILRTRTRVLFRLKELEGQGLEAGKTQVHLKNKKEICVAASG